MKPITVADAIEQYPVRLRRAQVHEMGRRLGLSDWTVRTMLEGRKHGIHPIVYQGTRKAYYDRQEVIRALFQPAAQTAMAS